jgi:hypothetical protein
MSEIDGSISRLRTSFKMNLLIAIAALLAFTTPAVSAEIVAKGDTISVTGPIEKEDYLRFWRAVTPQTKTVVLNSPGGLLNQSLAIGRLVRERKIAILIPNGAICSSGCAMVWLGGIPRDIHGNGRLGFHSAREQGQADCRKVKDGPNSGLLCDEPGNDLMISWLRETELYPSSPGCWGCALGWIGDVVIGLIAGIPPGEMRWLDRAEAMKLGFIVRPEPMPPAPPVPFVCDEVIGVGHDVRAEGIRCPKK